MMIVEPTAAHAAQKGIKNKANEALGTCFARSFGYNRVNAVGNLVVGFSILFSILLHGISAEP